MSGLCPQNASDTLSQPWRCSNHWDAQRSKYEAHIYRVTREITAPFFSHLAVQDNKRSCVSSFDNRRDGQQTRTCYVMLGKSAKLTRVLECRSIWTLEDRPLCRLEVNLYIPITALPRAIFRLCLHRVRLLSMSVGLHLRHGHVLIQP